MSNYTTDNLIPIDKSIFSKGQRVVKIGNNYFPIGIGGNFVPTSLTSNIVLYKCESVDVLNKIWYGYSAQKNELGIYEFANSLTELSYDFIMPEVGGIYSEDCLIQVAKLFTGSSALIEDEYLNTLGTNVEEEVLLVSGVKAEGEILIF